MRQYGPASPKGLVRFHRLAFALSTMGNDIPDDLREMILKALAG